MYIESIRVLLIGFELTLECKSEREREVFCKWFAKGNIKIVRRSSRNFKISWS